MTSRVSSKNIKKKGKKKKTKKPNKTKQNKKNSEKGTKKQKTASRGVDTGLSARASNFLDHCTTVTQIFEKLILSYENNFSLPAV